MVFIHSMGFSRFESLLGLTVLAVVLAFTLPRMKAGLENEHCQRAEIEARILAETIQDFHEDTGAWPHAHNGQADLAELTLQDGPKVQGPANKGLLGALVPGAAWLKEVPLDPWNRPYQAFIPSGNDGMILVISTGPNGTLEADRDQLAKVSRGGRIGTGPILLGDDIGYLQLETNLTGQP